ncbi:MAG: hypothetical protein CO017_05640, partial [Zetaproteobacteria bacterium CG_4_8_14_3_um_filter_59_5]
MGFAAGLFCLSQAYAQTSMDMLFDEQDTVISATESRRALDQSPAIVTVITEKQIKDMGVHTLIEVLEAVPGFKVSYAAGVVNGFSLSV